MSTEEELRQRLKAEFSLHELELLVADAFSDIGGLEHIVAPEHPLPYRVNELVKYCARHRRLDDLAAAIARSRGTPYYQAPALPRIPRAQRDNLFLLANEIFPEMPHEQEELIETLFEAYEVSAPPDQYFRRSDTGDAITLFREMIRRLENATITRERQCPLLEFVWHLSDKTRNDKLHTWISDAAHVLQLEVADIINRARGLAKERDKRHRYLIVKIDEDDSGGNEVLKKRFSLAAWFIKATHRGGYSDVLTLREEYAPTYMLEDIPKQISSLIRETRSGDELIIEMVLPLSLLPKNFDEWEYQHIVGSTLRIGAKYRFIVRSLERLYKSFHDEGIIDNWKQRWAQVSARTEPTPWLCSPRPNEPSALYYHLCEKGDCHIALGFTVTECDAELLGNLIAAGTPIAVWPRMGPLDCIEDLTGHENLKDWREAVRKQRRLGKQMTLLWDDPDRLPPGALGQGRLTAPLKARNPNHG